MGTVAVAALTADTARSPPVAQITATWLAHQFRSQSRQAFVVIVRKTVVDCEVATFDEAHLAQTFAEGGRFSTPPASQRREFR